MESLAAHGDLVCDLHHDLCSVPLEAVERRTKWTKVIAVDDFTIYEPSIPVLPAKRAPGRSYFQLLRVKSLVGFTDSGEEGASCMLPARLLCPTAPSWESDSSNLERLFVHLTPPFGDQ